jgi:hypothetical protein
MLEARHQAALRVELSALPSLYGFSTADDFVKAMEAAVERPGRVATSKRKTHSKKRAQITDDTRSTVKFMAENGKADSSIARATGISLQSVYNIKKELGLVKPRP